MSCKQLTFIWDFGYTEKRFKMQTSIDWAEADRSAYVLKNLKTPTDVFVSKKN